MSRKVYDTMKKRFYVCSCGADLMEIRWGKDPLPTCKCGLEMYEDFGQFGLAPGVITDDIPGGMLIRHGICNEDGSPKRYYTKSSIRAAAAEAGVVIHGETPNVSPRVAEARAREAEAKGRNRW